MDDVIGYGSTGVSSSIGNSITPPNLDRRGTFARPLAENAPPFHPAANEASQPFFHIRAFQLQNSYCKIIAMSLSNKLSITDVTVKDKKVLIRVS